MGNPADLGAIRDGATILGFLPFLRAEVARFEEAIEVKVSTEITQGTLTPDKALNYWMEKNSYRRLLRAFEQRVRVGTALAENTKALDLP